MISAVAAEPASAYIPTYQPTWAKSLDSGSGLDDVLYDVLVAPDGTVWACGSGLRNRYSNDWDMYLVRIPASGLRSNKYRWASGSHREDCALALARARDGSIYTVGYSTNGLTGADVRLVKWSAIGRVLWTRRIDGSAHRGDRGLDVVVDRYGNVTICGRCAGSGSDSDWVVASWSSSGVLRWKARYDREHWLDVAHALCVDTSGNVYVTGLATHDADHEISTTIKYSRTGKTLWRRSYPGAESGWAQTRCIARAPTGGVYVGGYSFSLPAGGGAAVTSQLVLHYASAGVRTTFVEAADPPAAGNVYALAVAPDGSVVTGGTQRDDQDVTCPAVWHFGSAGPLMASWGWPSSDTSARGRINDVAVDGAGNLYWAGHLKELGATQEDAYVPLIGRRSMSGAEGDWNGAWVAGGHAEPLACVASGSALYVVGSHQAGTVTIHDNMFVLKYQP